MTKKIFLKNSTNYFIILLIIILSIATTIRSLTLIKILDTIISKSDKLYYYLGVYVAIYAFCLIIAFFKECMINIQNEKMINILRAELTKKLSVLNFNSFNEKSSTEYLSWLSSDIETFRNNFFYNIFKMINIFTDTIFALIAIFNINHLLFFIVIIFTLIMFSTSLMSSVLEKENNNFSKQQEIFNNKIEKYLAGFSIFYFANKLNLLTKFISKESKNLSKFSIILRNKSMFYSTILTFITIFINIATLSITAILIHKNIISVGVLMGISNLTGSVYYSLTQIIGFLMEIKGTNGLIQKYDTFFENKPINLEQIDENLLPKKLEYDKIILKNVSYKYKDDYVLKNINLEFKKGKKYVIIGESGSGKSTLIKLITGIFNNYEGDIFLSNTNYKDIKTYELNNILSYLNHENFVFNTSIINNITLFDNNPNQELLQSSLKNSNLNLDLNYSIDQTSSLSAGQLQRIAIARTLYENKEILILDEALSNLDKDNVKLISENILNSNRTIILITHHLNENLKELFDYTINIKEINNI